MENARIINPSDVRLFYFGTKDVLTKSHERENRKQKIERAIELVNDEHLKINIILRLGTGETVQTQSDRLDYTDDFLMVNGGHPIPVGAILDIAVN